MLILLSLYYGLYGRRISQFTIKTAAKNFILVYRVYLI
jgi:hypothetical protein